MTNVNVSGETLAPLGGVGLDGKKLVYASADKGAQNDTVTLTNADEVLVAQVMVDDGSNDWEVDTFTIDASTSNMINLTGSTTGTVYIQAIVR